MLPIIKLSQAWLEKMGWTPAETANLLELDLAGAVPAGPDDKCPKCTRHHAEYFGSVFVPDTNTKTPERVHGRAYVVCLCRTVYWYAAVHEVGASQPVGVAEVRAASAPRPVAPGRPVGTFVADAQTYHRWYRPNASLYFTPEGFEAYYQQPRPKLPGT